MNEELEKQLIEKYPDLFRNVHQPANVSCMHWGIETGDGWYNILNDVCNCIDSHVKSTKRINEYRKENGKELLPEPDIHFEQIKEKFGQLRIYMNHYDDYVQGILSLAEDISARTCESCGKEGKMRKGGWIRCLCDDCEKEKY